VSIESCLDAIALYPTGSASGSWVFLHLQGMSTIIRKHGKSEPMPDVIIGLLNVLPAAEDEGNVVFKDVEQANNEVVVDEVVAANPLIETVPGAVVEEEHGEEPHPDEMDAGQQVENEVDCAADEFFIDGGAQAPGQNGTLDGSDVKEPGVHSDVVIEDVPFEEGGVLAQGELLQKTTRSGRAYSMKLIGKCAMMALVGKRISV
jgi:hypothetical protein